jgi:hypothetical protein
MSFLLVRAVQCAIAMRQSSCASSVHLSFSWRHPPVTIGTGATALGATTSPRRFSCGQTLASHFSAVVSARGPTPARPQSRWPNGATKKTPKSKKKMSQKEFLRQPTVQTKAATNWSAYYTFGQKKRNTHEIKSATDTAAQRCSVEVRCLMIEQGTETTSAWF